MRIINIWLRSGSRFEIACDSEQEAQEALETLKQTWQNALTQNTLFTVTNKHQHGTKTVLNPHAVDMISIN